MAGLTLAEFSDREVLAIVRDALDANGVTTSAEVAMRMNLDVPRPELNVASRLNWLRRYGVLERDGNRWRLSVFGEEMLDGRIRQTTRQQIENFGGAQWVTLMQEVAAARYRALDAPAGHMMRRAWVYGTHPLRGL